MLTHAFLSSLRAARRANSLNFQLSLVQKRRFFPGGLEYSTAAGPIEADRDSVTLSSEQRIILEKVLAGESVFFTGPSGTGKSLLLRKIIHQLRCTGRNVAVTASTGIAAVNVEGGTLHSFAGIGLGNQPFPYLIQKAKTPQTTGRWRETDVLIIDEISMIDSKIFEIVNEVGRILRRDHRPFGGLQLVVCGDFFQLPPVPDQMSQKAGLPVQFAFEADCWDEALLTKIALTKVFRQKEKELVEILNEMRMGEVSDQSLELIQTLARPLQYSDDIKPTEIFPMRYQADKANARSLNALRGERATYDSTDEFYKDVYGVHVHPQRGRSNLDKLISDRVELRVGAQVMSLKNVPDSSIVNGSVGVIQAFMEPRQHKPNLDLEDLVREFGVNSKLSRKRMKQNAGIWVNNRWPVVRFHDGTTRMIPPCCFTHKNTLGIVEASRWQVPLILAWALTVHKAQGQTLSRVKIDLQGTFERGQAYVALSRCTSLQGLEVYNFSRDLVRADPVVQEWHSTLTTIPDSSGQELALGLEKTPSSVLA